jgi:hypothetical protein
MKLLTKAPNFQTEYPCVLNNGVSMKMCKQTKLLFYYYYLFKMQMGFLPGGSVLQEDTTHK